MCKGTGPSEASEACVTGRCRELVVQTQLGLMPKLLQIRPRNLNFFSCGQKEPGSFLSLEII